MQKSELSEPSGDYLVPAFEDALVADSMRPGIFRCNPTAPLRTVARTMATNHIHSVVVARKAADGRPWGIISDIDLVRFAADADGLLAADVADRHVPTIASDRRLAEAATMMAEQRQTHLVVVDPQSGEPSGMLSALDVAGNLACALG